MTDQMTLLDVPAAPDRTARLVRIMDLHDISPAEVADIAGAAVDDVQAVVKGIDPTATDLRGDLLDVACERAVDAAQALRVDPSRPELWDGLRRALDLGRELLAVAQ